MQKETILVTGAAGFIGFHVAQGLCERGYSVVGFDNMNDYYDVTLKQSRIDVLNRTDSFQFVKGALEDQAAVLDLFAQHQFDYVIHLAAQAGVRYSITHPEKYITSNISGFLNVIEGCRKYPVKHFIYASSSSVYGANTHMPFSVHHNVDHPISLYAASKKSNELIAHTYSALFKIPTTGLRFFTVYGPYGRPDMAIFLFTEAILKGKPIKVFNNGEMKRDFTYVGDIVESIVRLLPKIPVANPDWSGVRPDPSSSFAPYRIFNIGNHAPIKLMEFIEVLEKKLNTKAIKEMLPLQSGDVVETFADVQELADLIDFKPATPIDEGIEKFVQWYTSYYKI